MHGRLLLHPAAPDALFWLAKGGGIVAWDPVQRAVQRVLA